MGKQYLARKNSKVGSDRAPVLCNTSCNSIRNYFQNVNAIGHYARLQIGGILQVIRANFHQTNRIVFHASFEECLSMGEDLHYVAGRSRELEEVGLLFIHKRLDKVSSSLDNTLAVRHHGFAMLFP